MIGYRSVVELHSPSNKSIHQIASELFFAWMRTKRLHPEFVTDREHSVGPNSSATKRDIKIDGRRYTRLALRETTARGAWVTTITTGDEASGSQWYWVDVEYESRDVEPDVLRWTATPRVARDILAVVDGWDGVVPLSLDPPMGVGLGSAR